MHTYKFKTGKGIGYFLLATFIGCVNSKSFKLEQVDAGDKVVHGSFDKSIELEERVSKLESNLELLKKLLEIEKNVNKEQEQYIMDLGDRIDDHSKHALTEDTASFGKETQMFRTSSNDNIRAKRQTDDHVAFSAYVDHEVLSMGKDQTIQFQNVLINEGNGYNKFTGIFTAPINGVYFLSFFVEDYHRFQSIFHMVVNRNIVTSAIVDPLTGNYNVQGGNVVFVRLNAGDAVWVTAVAGSNIEGYDTLRASTFSGHLVYA